MNNFNNQENSSQHVNQTKQPEGRGDHRQPDAASSILENNRLSSQQMEGLTDTTELQDASNTEDIPKNPENALQEEGSERERAAQLNDGSSGNQTIRDAVENLNQNELAHNLKDKDQEKSDKPSPNPAPFISPD